MPTSVAQKREEIAGVVVTRNEELNIVRCLEALARHVAEIILIDMESSDRTVEMARPYVSKVLTHPLVPVMDVARHAAIPETVCEWFWFVDADEFVPFHVGQTIADLVRSRGHEFEALQYPFQTYFCGKWMQHCGWWPGYTAPRVLKRGHFRFSDELHMGVHVEGRLLILDPSFAVPHFSYRSVEHWIDKSNRYTSTEAMQLAQRGIHWNWRAAMRAMVHDLWEHYELHNARLDGNRGWILTWLMSQYRWLSFAKLIDHFADDARDDTGVSVPRDLDEVVEAMTEELSALRAQRPRVPLDVILFTPLFELGGKAEEGRVLVKALAAGSRAMAVRESRDAEENVSALAARDESLFRALSRATRPKFTAAITNGNPASAAPDPCASLNILRTTCDCSALPPEWLPQVEAFDEVWVKSREDLLALRRNWIPPEKLRVVPSCIDTSQFTRRGERLELPEALSGRFLFLSILHWQYRHGWDVLLRAYSQEFGRDDRAGLLLKISGADVASIEAVHRAADQALAESHQSLTQRSDIVLWTQPLGSAQMPALYRSANAFVRVTRSEGSGRVYLEAMASGLPVIASASTTGTDLIHAKNSFLVPVALADVPNDAISEYTTRRQHSCYEPNLDALRRGLRLIYSDQSFRRRIGRQAAKGVRKTRNLDVALDSFESALSEAERRFVAEPTAPIGETQLRVELEGEFFACHSFAGVNEQLAMEFKRRRVVALSLRRRRHTATYDRQSFRLQQLLPLFDRPFNGGPHVTIRHAFPPNWQPPENGKWVQVQPWEYGHLPSDWIEPLRDRVDEAWVYSNYVRRVYEDSGIPSHKIHVIPLGVEPTIFNPQAPPLNLPAAKSFVFLFLGGAIERKGADVALQAFLEEFGANDDVCLVVKDMGSQTFYRDSPCRDRLVAAAADPTNPRIIYFDQTLSDGQLASLYTACHCLIAPYRGEGFGLPIVEAMACGVPPIVPRGGPSDDFVTEEIGFLLPSAMMEVPSTWKLCGPATELHVNVADVRRAMRLAFEDRARLAEMGRSASQHVLENLTWSKTVDRMMERLQTLVNGQASSEPMLLSHPSYDGKPVTSTASTSLCAFIIARNGERALGGCLAHFAPFVEELVVVHEGSIDRSVAVAKEYGARVYGNRHHVDAVSTRNMALRDMTSPWLIVIDSAETLAGEEIAQIKQCLAQAPPEILAISLKLADTNEVANSQLRVFRRDHGLAFHEHGDCGFLPKVARNQFQILELPIRVGHA